MTTRTRLPLQRVDCIHYDNYGTQTIEHKEEENEKRKKMQVGHETVK